MTGACALASLVRTMNDRARSSKSSMTSMTLVGALLCIACTAPAGQIDSTRTGERAIISHQFEEVVGTRWMPIGSCKAAVLWCENRRCKPCTSDVYVM